MSDHFEVGAAADRVDRTLQPGVDKRHHLAAAIADDVVVMVAAGIEPLVSGGAPADVHAPNQAQFLELLERSVDARPADRPQPPVDLKWRERATLAADQLDDPPPGSAGPVSGLSKGVECVLYPARGEAAIQAGFAGSRDRQTVARMGVILILVIRRPAGQAWR
jgi:hypothetical protein